MALAGIGPAPNPRQGFVLPLDYKALLKIRGMHFYINFVK